MRTLDFVAANTILNEYGVSLTAEFITDHPLGALVYSAALDLESLEDSIVRKAESLTSRLAGAVEHVRIGFGVNPLGEIQGAGSEFDVLCARRGQRASELDRLACAVAAMAEAAAV